MFEGTPPNTCLLLPAVKTAWSNLAELGQTFITGLPPKNNYWNANRSASSVLQLEKLLVLPNLRKVVASVVVLVIVVVIVAIGSVSGICIPSPYLE